VLVLVLVIRLGLGLGLELVLVIWLRLGLGLGLGLELGLGPCWVKLVVGVCEAEGGGLVVKTGLPAEVPVSDAADGVADGEVVTELVGELEREAVDVVEAAAAAAETEPVGVGVSVCGAEGGAPLGEGDAETSTAMRIALLLWSATTIEPSGKATALDGLLKDAAAPSPLPKPDAPPKSVVADCVDGSREITRLPPVSASSRRAPAASYQRPAGTRKRAAAPTPSTESWEPPPAKARATPVDDSTARTS
jgi:hypothetical protein